MCRVKNQCSLAALRIPFRQREMRGCSSHPLPPSILSYEEREKLDEVLFACKMGKTVRFRLWQKTCSLDWEPTASTRSSFLTQLIQFFKTTWASVLPFCTLLLEDSVLIHLGTTDHKPNVIRLAVPTP